MAELKVLIVDDSFLYRRILKKAVDDCRNTKVMDMASNGKEALDILKTKKPDVILSDLFMPEMNGLEFLRIIKKELPNIHYIMISGASKDNAEITVEALNEGALDFIVKPSSDNADRNFKTIRNHLDSLFTQIRLKNISTKSLTSQPKTYKKVEIKKTKVNISKADLVLIASSTGGPAALDILFQNMNKSYDKPTIIVQHMPEKFTEMLAKSLTNKTGFNFMEAQKDQTIEKGKIYIAAGGKHLLLKEKNGKIVFDFTDKENKTNVKPSADVLFESVAQFYVNKEILSVILTGMGNDGHEGVKHLKSKTKCYTITQNEESCVVYGMPMRVEKDNLSDESIHIKNIAEKIYKISYKGNIL